MFRQGCKPGVDYSQVDLEVGEENLLHHMIDPSYPANSIVYFLAVALAEVVSLCQDAGGVGLRHFEGGEEGLTSYVAEREETSVVEVGHMSHLLSGEVFDLVGTLVVLLCGWRDDKRDLAECI